MDRVVEISDASSRVSVRDRQLVVFGGETLESEVHRSPAEDLLCVCLDGRRTVLSSSTLRSLMAAGTAVLVSDERHLPIGLMVPLVGYSEGARRIRLQAELSLPRRKRVWQAVVRAKIEGQAENLIECAPDAAVELRAMARSVASGDVGNREAQAARAYWKWVWSDRSFRRSNDADGRNGFLDYGYAVARAAVARAICAHGLHAAFGISHHARENMFALADDLMEPLRPMVDAVARNLIREGSQDLGRDERMALAGVMHIPTLIGSERMPLALAVQRMASSYAGVVEGRRKTVEIPQVLAE